MTRYFRLICCILAAVVLSGGANSATAQNSDEPAPEASPQAATGAQPVGQSDNAAQAATVFKQKFEAYKAAIRDIEELQNKFQTADAATRQKLNAEVTGQVAHAQSLVNEMVEAAVEAFRADPKADPQITALLTSVVQYQVVGREHPPSSRQIDGGDRYERALPIIKVLVDGGVNDRDLLLWGFLSAFATNDFDLAEQFLQKAQQAQDSESQGASNAAKDNTLALVGKFASMLGQYRDLWAKESAIRAAEAKADDLPRVKLTTTKGEITLELFENEAPQSVANFLTLVKQGYYDGKPFHRVMAKFMAQGGAKNDDGSGELGYAIRDESSKPNHRYHFRGSLSMARLPGIRDSGGSQFFLTVVPTDHLDGEHTVFGRVMDGIEVVVDLNRREPGATPPSGVLPAPDRILKAEVLRDRGHKYAFEKLPEPR
jgi:cyclophilin family peptidyl-prolyl cis-trans isomerase